MQASHFIYLITLYVSLLSALMSGCVVGLYFHYRTHSLNTSPLLKTIVSLIFADGAVGCCVMIWEGMSKMLNDTALDTACRVMLPIPIMFFLVGYGCMVVICLRFLQVSRVSTTPTLKDAKTESSILPLCTPPVWSVWAVSFAITLPISFFNVIGGDYDVSRVITTAVTDEIEITYCMFDPTTWLARGTNFICFQVPLFLTIIINCGAFVSGMKALQHSPQSVIAREMKRVGQYLVVLLMVWVPNLVINLMQWISVPKNDMSFLGDDNDDDDELNSSGYHGTVVSIMVLLTTLQGVLNVIVYAWSHRAFRQYISSGLSRIFVCSLCPRVSQALSQVAGYCYFCTCCCGSLVEEDHFANRATEPVLRSFDEDGEPVTQNGYKCKVTYNLESGNSNGDEDRRCGVTHFKDFNQHLPGSHSSISPTASFFTPSGSVNSLDDRYSKDIVTDTQRLSSASSILIPRHALDIAPKQPSSDMDSSSSRSSATPPSTLSPLHDDELRGRDGPEILWPRSDAVPIPVSQNHDYSRPSSGGVVVGSLKSSMKSSVSPMNSKESPETRSRVLSDSEKMVRFR